MKLRMAVLVAITAFLISRPAFAQSRASEDTISISASANGFFTPDTAELSFAVETNQKTAQKAAQENAKKAASVVNALKALINEKAGESIRTSGYSVQPIYENQNTLTGYRAINEITISIHKLDKVGRMIDKGLSAGANRIESLNFLIGDETADCGEVIAKAGKKATKEAQALASSLGITLGKIKSASTSCNASGPFFTGGAMLAAKAETPVEIGQTRLNASVQLVFHIE